MKMNFHQSKQIFKDWNNYKNILLEVTEKELQIIDKTLDLISKDPSDLPFESLFGNKVRLAVPIDYDPYVEESELSKMLKTLIASGWVVDINTGIATKEFEKEFEGVKRIQKRQMKVNAIWTTLLDLLIKFDKEFNIAYDAAPDDMIKIAESPEMDKIQNQIFSLMGVEMGRRFSALNVQKTKIEIDSYIKTWQTEAGKIKGKLSKGSGYTMVISRHPIDVLRMSDYKNITSCHSPPSTASGRWAGGGPYYSCAIAEARSGGAIAMLVKTEDLEGVDLEQKEIFTDPTRNLEGIEPISRIRLRNIANIEENISLALPEKRIYGPDVVSFSEKLKQWALSLQAKQFEKILSTTKNNKIDMEDYTNFGGSYSDTPVFNLFADLIMSVPELKNIQITGKVQFSRSAQAEAEKDLGRGERALAEPIIENFNESSERERFPVLCDELWYVEEGYIHPIVYHYYDINKSRFRLTQNYEKGFRGIAKWLKEEFKEYALESFAESIMLGYDSSEELRLRMYLVESRFTEFGITNPPELTEFLSYVSTQYDDYQQSIQTIIEQYLLREGVYEGGKLLSFNRELSDQDFETDWSMTADEENLDLPKEINGELNFEISYNEIGLTPQNAEQKINYSFLKKIEKQILAVQPDEYDFNIAFDLKENGIAFYYNINMLEGLKDSIVVQLEEFLKIPVEQQKQTIIGFIKSYQPPTAPKTALNEYKHITKNWKKFLL
jgi:hypothetical protein